MNTQEQIAELMRLVEAHGVECAVDGASGGTSQDTGKARDAIEAHARTMIEQASRDAQDAARYRWLRNNHRLPGDSPFICRYFGTFTHWTDVQADEAIDAAMNQQNQPKKGDKP